MRRLRRVHGATGTYEGMWVVNNTEWCNICQSHECQLGRMCVQDYRSRMERGRLDRAGKEPITPAEREVVDAAVAEIAKWNVGCLDESAGRLYRAVAALPRSTLAERLLAMTDQLSVTTPLYGLLREAAAELKRLGGAANKLRGVK